MFRKNLNGRLSTYVLAVAVVVGIVSILAYEAPTVETFAEFFPPAEEIQYLSIVAEGEIEGSAVSREAADIEAIREVASAIKMEEGSKSYLGKKYDGTLYHLEMGYRGGEYDFFVATDGGVYHNNGKYFLPTDGSAQPLYQWLADFVARS